MNHLRILLIVLAAVLVAGWAATRVWPAPALRLAMHAESALAGLHHGETEVAGHRIVYLDSGGDGPVVVLLHGFGADKYNWPRMARHLTGEYRVIAPDLPGFGDSDYVPGAGYGMDAQQQRLQAFLSTLAPGPVHLVGNSMGGYIAAVHALANPKQVASLALFDAAGVDAPVATPFTEALAEGRNLLLTDSPADFEPMMDVLFVERPWIPGFVLDQLAREHAGRYERYAAIFADVLDSLIPLEQPLAGLDLPALILWGERDQILSVSSVAIFERLLPDSSTVILPETGHLPMLERPALTAQHYLDFLRRQR